MDGLNRFNKLDPHLAKEALLRCCGSSAWAVQMVLRRPFRDENDLFQAADQIWKRLTPKDWLEAFSHHPKIGDKASLKKKFAATAQWASGEQSGVNDASEEILNGLADGNQAYESKFGYIFIICATGKDASEMLSLLRERLSNSPSEELAIAAAEQSKITRIRLEKLLNGKA